MYHTPRRTHFYVGPSLAQWGFMPRGLSWARSDAVGKPQTGYIVASLAWVRILLCDTPEMGLTATLTVTVTATVTATAIVTATVTVTANATVTVTVT